MAWSGSTCMQKSITDTQARLSVCSQFFTCSVASIQNLYVMLFIFFFFFLWLEQRTPPPDKSSSIYVYPLPRSSIQNEKRILESQTFPPSTTIFEDFFFLVWTVLGHNTNVCWGKFGLPFSFRIDQIRSHFAALFEGFHSEVSHNSSFFYLPFFYHIPWYWYLLFPRGSFYISKGFDSCPATYEISIPSSCRACWSLTIYGYSTILHTLLMGFPPQCPAQATTANAFTTFEKYKTVFISSSCIAMNMVKKQSKLFFPFTIFLPIPTPLLWTEFMV